VAQCLLASQGVPAGLARAGLASGGPKANESIDRSCRLLRRGNRVELPPGWRAMTLGIHAAYPSRKHLPIKTRRLVDFLVQGSAVPGGLR